MSRTLSQYPITYLNGPANGMGLVATGRRKINTGNSFDRFYPIREPREISLGVGDSYKTLDEMVKHIRRDHQEASRIASKLYDPDLARFTRNIFNHIYQNFQYKPDPNNREQIKGVAGSYANRIGGIDCDDMALLAGTILYHKGIPFAIRKTAPKSTGDFGHVYIVVPKRPGLPLNIRSNYYVIDPVVDRYDFEYPKNGIPKYYDEVLVTKATTMNGLGCAACTMTGIEDYNLDTKAGWMQLRQNILSRTEQVPAGEDEVEFVEKLNMLIASWDDPDKREYVIAAIMADEEDEEDGMSGLEGKFFKKAFRKVKNTAKKAVKFVKKIAPPTLAAREGIKLWFRALGKKKAKSLWPGLYTEQQAAAIGFAPSDWKKRNDRWNKINRIFKGLGGDTKKLADAIHDGARKQGAEDAAWWLDFNTVMGKRNIPKGYMNPRYVKKYNIKVPAPKPTVKVGPLRPAPRPVVKKTAPTPVKYNIKVPAPKPTGSVILKPSDAAIKKVLDQFNRYNISKKLAWDKVISSHLNWSRVPANAKRDPLRAQVAKYLGYNPAKATAEARRLRVITSPAVRVSPPRPAPRPVVKKTAPTPVTNTVALTNYNRYKIYYDRYRSTNPAMANRYASAANRYAAAARKPALKIISVRSVVRKPRVTQVLKRSLRGIFEMENAGMEGMGAVTAAAAAAAAAPFIVKIVNLLKDVSDEPALQNLVSSATSKPGGVKNLVSKLTSKSKGKAPLKRLVSSITSKSKGKAPLKSLVSSIASKSKGKSPFKNPQIQNLVSRAKTQIQSSKLVSNIRNQAVQNLVSNLVPKSAPLELKQAVSKKAFETPRTTSPTQLVSRPAATAAQVREATIAAQTPPPPPPPEKKDNTPLMIGGGILLAGIIGYAATRKGGMNGVSDRQPKKPAPKKSGKKTAKKTIRL